MGSGIDLFPREKIEVPKIETKETDEDLDLSIERPDIDFIERNSRGALIEQNKISVSEQNSSVDANNADLANETKQPGLTEEEKTKIKTETGWSDEIIDAIGSMKEYEIYKKAGLQEAEINGKKCLIRSDIDMNQKDKDGISNAERIKRELAPLGNDGKPVNLHHIGQHKDSPLAELTDTEHKNNYSILHSKEGPTEVHDEGNTWNSERNHHWKARFNNIQGG